MRTYSNYFPWMHILILRSSGLDVLNYAEEQLAVFKSLSSNRT